MRTPSRGCAEPSRRTRGRSRPSSLVGAGGRRVESEIEDLESGGTATVSLSVPRGGFDRVTAVLINTETDPSRLRELGQAALRRPAAG